MNSLSLIILLLGFLANLSNLSIAFLFIGLIGSFIVTIVLMMEAVETADFMKDLISNEGRMDLEEAKKVTDEIKNHRLLPIFINTRKWFLSFVVIGFIFQAISIDQKYIVMIAASQVGEMALNSETAKTFSNQLGGVSSDATKLLQTYIKSETLKLQEDMEKSLEKLK